MRAHYGVARGAGKLRVGFAISPREMILVTLGKIVTFISVTTHFKILNNNR